MEIFTHRFHTLNHNITDNRHHDTEDQKQKRNAKSNLRIVIFVVVLQDKYLMKDDKQWRDQVEPSNDQTSSLQLRTAQKLVQKAHDDEIDSMLNLRGWKKSFKSCLRIFLCNDSFIELERGLEPNLKKFVNISLKIVTLEVNQF